ncbi:MAG: bifunctional (p)ppGpp synthetase/guanosine-3',5'-bis(diphosphate) 3'-pyrophosphohydrolase, partial [Alphaproteobacteria bacterium]|nr:bifunctional (p)ppGpp synthetase/guanosine-3',5'-bis(diphosphate) 3'-pyrophosphohydrolase [Alphaproteobacteria bacterium]
FNDQPERWLDIDWGDEAVNESHTARIKVMLANEPGALGDLSNLIAKEGANISNLNIANRLVSYFELLIDIEVKDVEHLNHILSTLKSSKVVHSVSRASE